MIASSPSSPAQRSSVYVTQNLMSRFIWSYSRLLPYFRYCPKLLSYNNFCHTHPSKTQISLIIRSVWSIIAVRKKTEQTFLVIVIQNSDQAGRMLDTIVKRWNLCSKVFLLDVQVPFDNCAPFARNTYSC